jgi:type 1 glutamine amidotransferase
MNAVENPPYKLGHVASEFEVPQMHTILLRGMLWAVR